MRKYYSDFVRHCTRHYFSTEDTPSILTSRGQYNNYISVSNVLSHYDPEKVIMIKYIYTSDSTAKAVSEISRSRHINSEEIWYIIQTYEREVAIERGIL